MRSSAERTNQAFQKLIFSARFSPNFVLLSSPNGQCRRMYDIQFPCFVRTLFSSPGSRSKIKPQPSRGQRAPLHRIHSFSGSLSRVCSLCALAAGPTAPSPAPPPLVPASPTGPREPAGPTLRQLTGPRPPGGTCACTINVAASVHHHHRQKPVHPFHLQIPGIRHWGPIRPPSTTTAVTCSRLLLKFYRTLSLTVHLPFHLL